MENKHMKNIIKYGSSESEKIEFNTRNASIIGGNGSGKSSLAFDTIYAEGQRRYVESLSSYARQFLGQMEKPDVDLIEGLSPAISIEQKTTARNPRSTVGTVTEVYDYLRLLYARVGIPHCPKCGTEISTLSVDQILDRIKLFPNGSKLQILAPILRQKKGEHKDILDRARKDGFQRVRINGEIQTLDEDIVLKKSFKTDLDIVVDRLVVKDGIESRLSDSVETALKQSDGIVVIQDETKDHVYSQKLACPNCDDVTLPELTPRLFSFNSPHGACQNCDGLGALLEFDENLIISDENLSLVEGAIEAWGGAKSNSYWFMATLEALSKKLKFNPTTAWNKLSRKIQEVILYGDEDIKIDYDFRKENSHFEFSRNFEGVIPNLSRRYKETKSDSMRQWYEGFMTNHVCPSCKGKRLSPGALAVKIKDIGIDGFTEMSIEKALHFSKSLVFEGSNIPISEPILKEINQRLTFLRDVGVGYLNVSRSASTLSGGEMQRIRLASQIGSQLMGVMYVLDEPSIGLHQRDNLKLITTLKNLRALGNTVVVVEHDMEMMMESDWIVDFGPLAGDAGGEIVAIGTPQEIKENPQSLTGKYLSGKKKIHITPSKVNDKAEWLILSGANENNLKNITTKFPLGKLICITGVSGSGKSSLIDDTLYHGLARELSPMHKEQGGAYESIAGFEKIKRVAMIDQSPIGRTPRSNPATYTKMFDFIREIFTQTAEAKLRGYKSGRFSFNVKGGRCEACQGEGQNKIEMQFLPDVYVDCEVCKGLRYNWETLQVEFKGKNIAQVLEMTVEEALQFFRSHTQVMAKLQTLYDVGLGYIKLGQPAPTLSGGEAQRIKLSAELSKVTNTNVVYLLDEPTTGLHFVDLEKLLLVLKKLVEKGNTVIVIEHNLDIIKNADWIIDMGPEGGDGGGEIIAVGTPKDIANCDKSWTGKYLKAVL